MDFYDKYPQRFYLLSVRSNRLFSFISEDRTLENEVEQFFEQLPKVEGGNLHAEFRFETSMLEAAITLSDRLKDAYPSIQQLPTYFRQLAEGDYFVRQNASVPLLDIKRSIIRVKAHADGEDQRKYDNAFSMNWGVLYLKFEAHSYGFINNRIKIGEPDKNKRVCRFCGTTGKEHFKEDAHAIVEALGNKLLFCNEECDQCNQRFEGEVEKYLFKFCEIPRTIANISGKGSQTHHLEGLNFHIHPDPDTLRPVVYVMNEHIVNDSYKGHPTGKIHLYNKGEISYWGVYKSLIKIAVDLIPEDKFPHFKQTAAWVHGDFEAENLPPFLYGEHNDFFQQPVLDLFFRNEQSPSFSPYCTCILYVFSSIFIFTVPFCDLDDPAALTADSLNAHWGLFKSKQYLYIQEWEEYDSNDKTLLTPLYKLNIFEKKPNYDLQFKPATDKVFEIVRN